MLSYIQNKDEKQCCGCRACEQICSKRAISMQKNEEGFLYPVLDEAICINCGQCENVCPMMNRPYGERYRAVYAVQHKDEDILKDSSSGGVFRMLADEVIRDGGYVIGCAWDEEYRPVLRIAHSLDELAPMQGSKYVESDTNTVFSQVKRLLEANEIVLFTGTPCQCAGLINFLCKSYDKLLIADFLCHGVPSQALFAGYLDHIRTKRHASRITSYQFRDKSKRGWGLVSSYTWERGGKIHKNYAVGMTDSYEYGFLNGYFNRYSCYVCPFRGDKRFTDFTFCDYWGVERYHQMDLEKGVSAVTLNSNKAENYAKKLLQRGVWLETAAEYVAIDNPALLYNHAEEIPALRASIYGEIKRCGWRSIERKYLRSGDRVVKLIWYSLPISITKCIKKVVKKG